MQSMLQAAQSSDWTSLASLDEERKSIIEQDSDKCSDKETTPTMKDGTYIDLVDTIKFLDKRIIAAVVSARDGLASENRVLREQVKAKAIYQQASSMGNSVNR